MARSLTARIAWSHILLAVAVNVLLLLLLGYGLGASFDAGSDSILRDLVERKVSSPEGLTEADLEGIRDHDGPDEAQKAFLRAIGRDGELLSASGWRGAAEHPILVQAAKSVTPGQKEMGTLKLSDGRSFRFVTRKLADGSSIQGGFLTTRDSALASRLLAYGVGGTLVLSLVSAATGWAAARAAMRGVKQVTRTAQQILDGSREARVPAMKPVAEVAELAGTFNRMLDTIEGLVRDVKDVTAGVAHDLKTPLARVRSQAELALRGDQAVASYREAAQQIVEETVLLDGLLETILEVAAIDAGSSSVRLETIDLRALANDTAELFLDAAEERRQRLEVALGAPILVSADRRLLQRVLSNLLDNALKFTPLGGAVHIAVMSTKDETRVSVSDSGPGIEQTEHRRVTKRFSRGDAARHVPGQGLGLAYVEAAAAAHGGVLEISKSTLGGARFDVVLPRDVRFLSAG